MTKKPYIVVIDDERRPAPTPDGIELAIARTSKAGIELLQRLLDDGAEVWELWLDHDLGEDDNAEFGYDTIMPVVEWLEERGHAGEPFPTQEIIVHTQNAAMAPVMIAGLSRYYTVSRGVLPQ